MSTSAPSLQALRALRQLCRTTNRNTLRLIPRAAIQIPRLAQSPKCQTRARSTVTDGPGKATFANDPQLDANYNDTTALPDITSYYTLFPRTLPHGPPHASNTTTTTTSESQPKFYINPRDLRQEYLQLQSIHHPDKYPAGSTAQQKAYALSTLLNNAYKTLVDPLLRAQYILQTQFGIDVTTEDSSQIRVDKDTLIEVMEMQEEAEDAESQDQVNDLIEENRDKVKLAEAQLGDLLEGGRGDDAALEAVRLKYLVTLGHALGEWEPGKQVRIIH